MSATVFKGEVNEDGSATLLNRVCAETGSSTPIVGEGYPVKQADLASISYSIFDTYDGSTVVSAQALTVSAVIFDTLQQASGPIWTADAQGYNFRHALPATSFPNGNRVYRYEAKLTFASGDVAWALWDLTAQEVRTS